MTATTLEEAYRECLLKYRHTLRQLMFEAGIPSNPGSDDDEILTAISRIVRRKVRQRFASIKRREGPIVHMAERADAGEEVHMGPALCKAGLAHRTEHEQYVAGRFDFVDCRNCQKLVRAEAAKHP